MLKLREIRKKKHLTQQKVAMDLNLSVSALGHYETGRREPSIETLKTLARYYHVSLDYLTGLEDESIEDR